MTAQNIQDDLSAPDTLELRAKLFRGLSDPSRLTILDALVSDERNVQEIVGIRVGQPTSRTICAVCWMRAGQSPQQGRSSGIVCGQAVADLIRDADQLLLDSQRS